jgi:hypothetical protein
MASPTGSRVQLRVLEAELDVIRDDMVATREIEMRLRILMDPVATVMSTQSNMLQKGADTNTQIVRNLR